MEEKFIDKLKENINKSAYGVVEASQNMPDAMKQVEYNTKPIKISY